ncbi:MAG TPA: hypothetical protein VLA82_05470 [Actinomycetota bacterium]|nr:hypothetical protein [Actinomycetota bacterium]
MSSSGRSAPVRRARRVERWLVGVAFGVIAFVLERVVMRSVRRDGGEPRGASSEPRAITSRGGDVDVG